MDGNARDNSSGGAYNNGYKGRETDYEQPYNMGGHYPPPRGRAYNEYAEPHVQPRGPGGYDPPPHYSYGEGPKRGFY